MDAITIVNESARPVRVAIFRRPASDSGVTLVWKVVQVPGRGQERLPAEHFAVSLLCQLPSGYGRTKVVSFPGPPARFEVRQKNPAETPFLAAVSEATAGAVVRVANRAAVPVQVFLYREDREIERSDFLAPGEDLACEIRPDLCLALLEDLLGPGDELPPQAQERAVAICRRQTARITGSRRRGFKVEVV
jgi:hypothetical protein